MYQLRSKFKALDARGIAHFVAPLAVVLVVGVIGTYMLVASHADSTTPTPRRVSIGKFTCGTSGKYTAQRALADDFFSSTYRGRISNGVVCVRNGAAHGNDNPIAPKENNLVAGFTTCGANQVLSNVKGTGAYVTTNDNWVLHYGGVGGANSYARYRYYSCVDKKALVGKTYDKYIAGAMYNGIDGNPGSAAVSLLCTHNSSAELVRLRLSKACTNNVIWVPLHQSLDSLFFNSRYNSTLRTQ